MVTSKQQFTKEHKIVVAHLRKSRDLGKHILKISNKYGSALIEHKFVIKTVVSPKIDMVTEIEFLPIIRLYKPDKNKIVDDENLINEDIEDVSV